jgi:TonB-linked SusC/RagA family outer membrane protein
MHFNCNVQARRMRGLSTKICLVMKLTAFVLLVTCLHVSAAGYSQKVTLNVKNMPLQQVFTEIITQTGVSIVYSEKALSNTAPVTLNVKDATVQQVLDICTRHQQVVYAQEGNSFVIRSLAPAAPAADTGIRVTGKVTTAGGASLPGATVLVKGTHKGTQADANGNFVLNNVGPKDILVISSIGYTAKEVAAGARISIQLDEDTRKVNEVVVVGYSDKKKSELTSAVSVVSEDKLKDVTTNDLGSMLQGKVAGLQVVNASGVPGAASEIRLRGVSSINANQTPLYVVDGIIGGNYDPNDVESVTVLKDAGATAMYGSQANAGVVIVTTKKAKLGKTRFEAKVASGFRTPDYGKMQMMTGSELYDHQKEYYRDYIPGATDNSYKIDILKFYSERPQSLRNQNNSWLNDMFSTAPMTNAYLSASGSTEKADYYTGISYYNEQGTFMKTNYQRLNLRANSTYHFSKDITVTNAINLSGTSGKSYNYDDIFYAYLNMPWDNPYDSLGKPLYVDQTSSFKWWSRDKVNPIHTVANSAHPVKTFDMNYDLGFNANITPWLTFNSSNRVAVGYNKATDYYSPVVAGTYHTTNGYLNELSTFSYGLISTDLLKFNFHIGDHSISGLAGVAIENNKSEILGASGKGLPQGLSVLNVVSNGQLVAGSNTQAIIQSLISQISYGYKEKYFLTGSYRVDGSTAFPANHRYGSFPALSAAWLVSNEPFLQGNPVFTTLKLRASYGVTGTQDIGASRYLGLYALTSQYNGGTAATPSQLPSENLTWESKQQANVGLDLSLFNRINLTVDAYNNVTKRLLLQVPQPLSVGFEQRWENVGRVTNNGIELGLNTINIKSKDFTWETDFNISFNSNKLSDLPTDIIRTQSTWSISQIYRNGGNLYEFYMPKWLGVDKQTGAPQWEVLTKDANGKVVSKAATSSYADATYEEVGSALPKFQGGINSVWTYKGISLSANAYFLSGNKVFSNNLRFVENDGNEPLYNQIVLPGSYKIWTKPGDVATEPSPQNSANSTETSTRYLKNGNFFALRNISLSYALPQHLVKNWGLDGVTFGLTADNVYTFTKFLGQDPSTTLTSSDFVMPGVSDFKYPNNHQYLFNVNIRF